MPFCSLSKFYEIIQTRKISFLFSHYFIEETGSVSILSSGISPPSPVEGIYARLAGTSASATDAITPGIANTES